ncbi:MAG: CNNM domain-containing protein [Chthoniobacteraceae bacterium]
MISSLLTIVLCLLVSFVFSGIEAGIFSVNRVRLAHRAKQQEHAAVTLQGLLASSDRMLVTVLIVTNLANIFALVLGTRLLVAEWGERGYLVALAIYLPVYLFGLELLPKSLFRRFPYRALAFLSGPLRLLDSILTPIHWIGSGAQRLLFGGRGPDRQRLFLGREDFKYMTTEGERSGTISKTEREMIHNVVDFRGVTAKNVMMPIDPALVIGAAEPISRIIGAEGKRAAEIWFVSDGEGRITGVVDPFEVLLEGRCDVDTGSCQRRVVTVGPNEPAFSVLWKLRAARSTVAVVRGPGTQPIGRVTWGDLIRRLVSTAERREPDGSQMRA